VRTVLLALIVAAGLASAIAMQSARDRWFPEVASPVDEIYFSSGEALGRMALSYKSLLADVYWIRAVQYFGGTRLDMKNGVMPAPGSGRSSYDLLYPLLDVTTTLDPSFNIAYRFGATFLAEGYPNGPGRPDQAVALLDKGFANNPADGSTSTTRPSSTTGRSGTTGRPRTGSPRPRRCRTRRRGCPAWRHS
jgi:hypothetical protein